MRARLRMVREVMLEEKHSLRNKKIVINIVVGFHLKFKFFNLCLKITTSML